MATISKSVVDSELRHEVFTYLLNYEEKPYDIDFIKINDRQYGCILTDKNGVERYIRIGAIVAEEREDMTARELMQSEIDAYQTKQSEKAAKAAKRAEKAAKDKAAREAKAAEEEGE